MAERDDLPQRFPVRKVGDQRWEVLIATENVWLPCETEKDAGVIAAGAVLEYESLECSRSGQSFADELEELANTLEKYQIGYGTRFFRRKADEVRRAGHA